MPAFLKLVGRMPDGARLVRVGDRINARAYLLVSRELVEPDWQLMYLTPVDPWMGAARARRSPRPSPSPSSACCLFYCASAACASWRCCAAAACSKPPTTNWSAVSRPHRTDLMATTSNCSTRSLTAPAPRPSWRATQDELVQASKLAALGQMAAGITHELNQPLAALRTFSDNTRVLLERGQHGAAADNLRAIADLTERMGKITAQLKLFAGRSRRKHVDVPVRVALDHVLALLRPRLAEVETALHWRLPEAECVVRADELKLEQVLINLIGNALDAIAANDLPRPGHIDIDIGPADGAPAQLCIAVRDNGPGIPADAMPHLFEPFFTTKEIGQGLGLGLAISTSIARDFGGSLSAINVPGGGAQFTLSLVRAEAVPATMS